MMTENINIEYLISAVQERPALWDKRHKNYHNRLLSHREWESVSRIIGCTNDAAKKKWKNLRDSYAKEMKKIVKPRSGANAEEDGTYTGTWPYYESMSFLKVVMQPRKASGNIRETDDITEDFMSDLSEWTVSHPSTPMEQLVTSETQESAEFGESLQEASVNDTVAASSNAIRQEAPGSSKRSNSTPLPIRNSKKKKSHDNFEEAFLDMEREKIHFLKQKDDDDEDLHWFKSIVPYIKQLPPLQKLLFRTNIQEMLITEISKLSHVATTNVNIEPNTATPNSGYNTQHF